MGSRPTPDAAVDDIDAAKLAPPRNRYEIRILPDGRVVFVDLPGGLAEVAQVVAGSAPETRRLDADLVGDKG
jgi:hypothetical protein